MAQSATVQASETGAGRGARAAAAAAFLSQARWKKLKASASASGAPRARVTVYAEGCPPQAFRDVLDALAREGRVTDPCFDGEVAPGTYHHHAAYWTRLPQLTRSDAWCVVRELATARASATDTVEDGCGSVTSFRYEWDRAEVEPYASIPHAGEQGYTVRIAGVSRDPETLLVSYYVSTTSRKTRYLGVTRAGGLGALEAEDAYSTTREGQWLGLRGTQQAPSDDAGDGVTVWDPAAAALRELVSVGWSRNLEDCTLDARGRRQRSKPDVESGRATSETAFERSLRVSTASVSAGPALAPAPAAAAGAVVRRDARLRPDGAYDVSEDVGQELPFEASRVVKGFDVFGLETQITDLHQASSPADIVPGGGISGSLSVDTTPGRLKNVTVSLKREFEVEAATSEDRTVFSRRSRRTLRSSPGAPPPATAAGGAGMSVSAQLTPGGRSDIVTEVQEELFVGAASAEDAETLFETVNVRTDRNSRAPRPAASAAGGVIVQTSEELQPLGSRDIRVRTTVERKVTDAVSSLAEDAYSSRAGSSARGLGEDDVDGLPRPDAAPAGEVRTLVLRRTPGGLVDAEVSADVEKPVPGATVEYRATATGRTVTVRDSSADAPHEPPEAGTPEAVSATLTRGGLYDRVRTVSEIVEGVVTSANLGGNAFADTTVTETLVAARGDDTAGLVTVTVPAPTPGDPSATRTTPAIRSVSYRLRDDGAWVRSETLEVPRPAISFWFDKAYIKKVAGVYVAKRLRILSFYQASWDEVTAAFDGTVAGPENIRIDVSVDRFGLYTGSFSALTTDVSEDD